jgi:putative membrane protein
MQFPKKEIEILERGELTLLEYLAVDRNKLANQRTLLVYIRLGLYFFIFGLSVYKIEALKDLYSMMFLFFGLGFTSIIIGIIQYYKINKVLNKYVK